MLVTDSERLRSAAGRFVGFFQELSTHFIERDDLLRQVALSLLAREHTLMTGPPGTAKSSLAHAVLGRIVCEQTGKPSLLARQFTESTVQTDLVGPIDFKTLLETGRTEHFTDEGMLGAVHAFLDEVFDGRDMLLRSTLNVLHERELKQGTKTTRGQIECALMTTNRYLAEILETSSETLLAFVDRIAFVGFVPRGFSDVNGLQRVLRIQVAGTKPPPLSAPLSIQDLDLLQDAVDSVFIAEDLTDQLAAFVKSFEVEMDAVRRADPTFIPTRYLSTRSMVRLGRMLRAICLHDWASSQQSRELVAQPGDFRDLRLGLILSGPSPEQVEALLGTETDPRERRQLSIMRTEREVFDRCLAKLAPGPRRTQPPAVSAELLARAADSQLAGRTDRELLELCHQLAQAASSGRRGAEQAQERLRTVVHELSVRAFRGGLGARAEDECEIVQTFGALADLSDDLERAGGEQAALARWLRTRTLEAVYRAMELGPTSLGAGLRDMVEPPASPTGIGSLAHSRLRRLRELSTLRERLLGNGAEPGDSEQNALRWRTGLDRVERELRMVWDDGMRAAGAEAFSSVPTSDLGGFLQAMVELLLRLRESAAALGELGGDEDALVADVMGPRIRPYVQAAFERFDAKDRLGVGKEVSELLVQLEGAGLRGAVAPCDLVAWSADALLRAERANVSAPVTPDYYGYCSLRRSVPRVSLAYTLADIALGVAPRLSEGVRDPRSAVERLSQLLQAVPRQARRKLADRDTSRIEQAVQTLEDWYSAVERDLPTDPSKAFQYLADSRFFAVTRDESALTRFALEAELVQRVFPEAKVQPLLSRLRDLERRSWELVQRVGATRGEHAWREALRRPRKLA